MASRMITTSEGFGRVFPVPPLLRGSVVTPGLNFVPDVLL